MQNSSKYCKCGYASVQFFLLLDKIFASSSDTSRTGALDPPSLLIPGPCSEKI